MGSFYMEATQINYRRDETVKTVDQKLQELSETSAIDTDIAPVFKSTNTYSPGDMVYYRNKLTIANIEQVNIIDNSYVFNIPVHNIVDIRKIIEELKRKN